MLMGLSEGKPQPLPNAENGLGSEMNPYILNEGNEPWEDFLSFIYGVQASQVAGLDNTKKLAVHSNVLYMSHKYLAENAYVSSIRAFENYQTFTSPSPFSAAVKLGLAITCGIKQWIGPALLLLIQRPIGWHSESDIEAMTLYGFAMVARGTVKLVHHRYQLAPVIPDCMGKDPDWRCDDHVACTRSFKNFWKTIIIPKLTQETFPIWYDDIPAIIDKQGQDLQMALACKREARTFFEGGMNGLGDPRRQMATELANLVIKQFRICDVFEKEKEVLVEDTAQAVDAQSG
ncbi:hypothetical protein C8J56DRAFT_1041897 [Mycena floridula]|nr:hypothetical protein C8J56DRAFT_1041897 [Mycena floridula]